MRESGSKLYLIVPLLVIIIIFIAYMFSWDIGAYFHPDQTTDDMAVLTKMISDQIDEGKNSGDFYIKNIDMDELAGINDYICSLNGNVSQYSILEKSRHGMKVRFFYEISDNYYVYQKYVNGTGIPSDRPAAMKLYEKVNEIIPKIISSNMTDYEKELAIHDYIVTNCEYGYADYSNDYAYRAYGVLVQGKAVCNGYAEAMALLLNCVGVENEIMTGWASGELHAWNRVKLDGKWYQVDSTWDDPIPDRGSFAGHQFFNVTDDIMDDTHIWTISDYETCDSMDYNYFKVNNSIGDYTAFKNKIDFLALRNPYGTVEYVLTDYDKDKYDMSQIANVQGITSFTYSPEPYGSYYLMTINFNK
ncbi:MAG: hypothetical protein IJ224_11085 [Lachnospiraceae bacterium]|nr:hypothetical protein [Lachnospiraceae bacterium]